MEKSYNRQMIEEWAKRTPGITLVPQGEGALDTLEKIQAYEDRMREAIDKYRKTEPLPRKPWCDTPRRY